MKTQILCIIIGKYTDNLLKLHGNKIAISVFHDDKFLSTFLKSHLGNYQPI